MLSLIFLVSQIPPALAPMITCLSLLGFTTIASILPIPLIPLGLVPSGYFSGPIIFQVLSFPFIIGCFLCKLILLEANNSLW